MKKILFIIALCTITGTLMAQNTTLNSPGNTLGSMFNQPIKIDSSLYKSSSFLSMDNLFKQEPIDIKKLMADQNQKPLLVANDLYKMPVAKLSGNSKMPVVVLEGYSKMPIAGKVLKRANNTVLVKP